jgi:isoamylase
MFAERLSAGRPTPLGATVDGDGVNFAVFSANASRIELCLFSADGTRELERITLPERTGPVWHGHVGGLGPGALYGFRVHGPYAPERGHRFNHHKLLLDPYARALSGGFGDRSLLLGYDPASPQGDASFSLADSAPAMPKCVVTAPFPPVDPAERPRTPWQETVIYEAHVKGLTRLWPGLPEEVRGTYDGLASPPVVEHLRELGVTAIELLPVQAFIDDAALLDRGLVNYWGYNTIGFFTPEPRYFGPGGLAGFRETVRRLHAAGIEVILDVVYNHTGESDQFGPTLCFRGLDNASYYRLQGSQPRLYVNDAGTGNTLNLTNAHVLRMVLDSLRWWVEAMGVDGFRFDLATVLGREAHGFDPEGGFLDALRQDPVLATVKLIAEPWDLGPGGYQLGKFPPEFAEWNDGFRDAARRFWRNDPHSAQELAERLLGSAGAFDSGGRRTWASVNYVACHDGFTLADVVAYSHRHNWANGEGNSDGHHENYSDNCGVEGPTDDPEIRAVRALRQRNLLATAMLAQGTPMLLAGDEVGHSQGGNNNAYCQDNRTSWIDWAKGDPALLAFVRRLIALRRDHPSLRQGWFLHGRTRPADGLPDVVWRSLDGHPVNWRDPGLDGFCILLREAAETPAYARTGDMVVLAFHGAERATEVVLPAPPPGRVWLRALDTADPEARPRPCPPRQPQPMAAHSISAFVLETAQ